MSVYNEAISAEKRRLFISEMNKKWQKKHEREEAWLDQLDSGQF